MLTAIIWGFGLVVGAILAIIVIGLISAWAS